MNKNKSLVKYILWKIINPFKPFSDYYVRTVKSKIKKSRFHPTLGRYIIDLNRFHSTSKFELNFLIQEGLKPHHKLCDFGCGSLRFGEKVMEYLNSSNYYGLDITDEFFLYGLERIGKNRIEHYNPTIKVLSNDLINSLKESMDFIFSSAVMYHIKLIDISDYLISIYKMLSLNGAAYIDFTSGNKYYQSGDMTWVYTIDQIENICKDLHIRYEFIEPTAIKESNFYPIGHSYLKIYKVVNTKI